MKAIEVAKMFAQTADKRGLGKAWGSGRIIFLTEKQAKWLMDLMIREQDGGHESVCGDSLTRMVNFSPVEDSVFRFEFLTMTRKGGQMRMSYQWK